ncbi:hypothetical protein ACH4LN_05445 [Streptomyces albus]|uniref:Uncharacterized protein n=1 Tax=Streptomyces albus TaxID=1888 RepID=A0A6C1C7C8_9ACTN|nr:MULTISPECIES: hypothetical protein [Streptomyces]KPC96658.1 hypothetical protein ADL27_02095 [Streptomyces sp. NRRL F-6602]EPD89905.1 hypothetical protein HMPREF1486_06217 [Streptomyces sp. HPH0547]MDI6411090.1 hypothetical protein [Streptomyces albus]QID37462.1 hypothetical protein G3260_003900 [Streptomyces albus]TGG77709.1 hypothetical protein D8771_26970 [Streptomyces albus]
MGLTHDFRDVARDRGRSRDPRGQASPRAARPHPADADAELDIPRILRRRARWVGARLRHARF